MASVHHLYVDAYFIAQHILSENHSVSEDTKRVYFAAVSIQRTWRGYVVRQTLKKWNRAAVMIQKHVRGWLWRWHLPEFYREYLDWLTMKKYNDMATKIQRLWRGYVVRKRIGNINKIRRERRLLAEKNASVQKEIEEEFQRMRARKVEEQLEECKETVLFVLFKLHHLLRTEVTEGIYSCRGQKKLSFVEHLLKALKFKSYMRTLRKENIKYYNQKREQSKFLDVFDTVILKNFMEAYRKRDKTGDLKDIKTNVVDIHNNPFVLKKRVEKKPYERFMFSSEKYTGKKKEVYRHYEKSKNISKTDFDLHVFRVIKKEPKFPPYYMDIWRIVCDLHNMYDE